MNDESGLRVFGGILLILLGVAGVAYSALKPAAGAMQELAYDSFIFAMFSSGLWLILRKDRG